MQPNPAAAQTKMRSGGHLNTVRSVRGRPCGQVSPQRDHAITQVPTATVQPAAVSTRTSNVADDASLIREAQIGNHAAFEQLVHRYDQAVLRLALHLTGSESEAQDIYQEAFLKAYRNLVRFRFECSFYTWMYRIVANLCLDHLRHRRIRREDSPLALGADGE